MGRGLEPVEIGSGQIDDVYQWLDTHVVRFHDKGNENAFFHRCLGRPLSEQDIENYLAGRYLISVDFQHYPDLLEIWKTRIQEQDQPWKICTCSLREHLMDPEKFIKAPHRRSTILDDHKH